MGCQRTRQIDPAGLQQYSRSYPPCLISVLAGDGDECAGQAPVAVALQDSQGHDVQHPVMVQHSTQQPHVLTVLQAHVAGTNTPHRGMLALLPACVSICCCRRCAGVQCIPCHCLTILIGRARFAPKAVPLLTHMHACTRTRARTGS